MSDERTDDTAARDEAIVILTGEKSIEDLDGKDIHLPIQTAMAMWDAAIAYERGCQQERLAEAESIVDCAVWHHDCSYAVEYREKYPQQKENQDAVKSDEQILAKGKVANGKAAVSGETK